MPPRAELPPNGIEQDAPSVVADDNMSPEDRIEFHVTAVQDDPTNFSVVCRAIHAFLSLLQNGHGPLLSQSGAPAQVFGILQNHSNYVRLMDFSLYFLNRTVAPDAALNPAIVSDETTATRIESIVSVMRLYQEHVAIQRHGALLLFSYTISESPRNVFMGTDNAVTAMIFAMQKLPSERSVQCAGSVAILELLENDGSNVKDKIQEAGGVSILVDFLKRYGSHPRSQDSMEAVFVFQAMALMLEGSESAKETLVEQDGISAILSTMKHQTSNEALQFEALKCIRYLVDSNGRQNAFVDAKGIGPLTALLKEHPGNADAAMGVSLLFVKLAASNPIVADIIAFGGGLTALIEVMPRHINHVGFQYSAGCALGACASHEETLFVKGVIQLSPNVMHCIVTAMQQHSDNEDYQVVACSALRALSFSVEMCDKFINSGGVPVLLATIKKFQKNVRHQSASVITMEEFAQGAKSGDDLSGKMIDPMVESGAVATLLHILCHSSGKDALTSSTLRSLRIMAETDERVQEEIASHAGVMKLLLSIQHEAEGDTAVERGDLQQCAGEASRLLQYIQESEDGENRKA